MSLLKFLVVLLLAPQIIKAQERNIPYSPGYILVELPTQKNRIDFFTNAGDLISVNKLKVAEQQIITNMVQDFNEYFKVRPYYFFVDTNAQKVLNGDFVDILLDKNLKTLPANELPDKNDTTRYIVYYGYLTASNDLRPDYVGGDFPILIGMNYKFQQLPVYMAYRCYNNGYTGIKTERTKYDYVSKYFNLRFRPQALSYNETLKGYIIH